MTKETPNIVTIVQVSRGSSRLPDKVLLPIEGKHLFVRQIERINASELKGTVVVATTINQEDDIIESICKEENILCFRGDEHDLLDRHYKAALRYDADIAIKIPSDCPLIDPKIIDKVIRFFLDNIGAYDYVSNLHPASYPDGNDVEVMTIKSLMAAWNNATLNFEREHTTPYIWEHPEQFRIGNVSIENDYSMSHRWTIDYKEDYDFIKKVYEMLYPVNPLFSMEDILNLLDKHPEIAAINSKFAGVNWHRNHLDELKTIKPEQTKVIAN